MTEECCSQPKECCHTHHECHEHSHGHQCCHGGEDHQELTHYFFDLADKAWEEVLKDKVKEYILKNQNDQMKELAKIVAEGNNQRWKNRMQKKHSCMDFREKLVRFFSKK